MKKPSNKTNQTPTKETNFQVKPEDALEKDIATEEKKEEVQTAQQQQQTQVTQPKAKKEKKKGWWRRKTTGQKVSFCFSMFFFVLAIFLIIYMNDLRAFGADEAADKIYGKGVANGWVAIGNSLLSASESIFATIVIIAIMIFLQMIVNFLTRLFARGRRGLTIGALIRSLAKYVFIILGIAIICGFWGVDLQSILAGVGIVTLIVGLGCQTLIQDVIAGLFIVFDDYFAVGDIVIIDGFRGTISDIGLKSTKLQDAGGNIKSINNSSITTVVNLSRMDSIVTATLSAGYNEDPIRVEGILIKALPEIQKKIPAITDTLTYKGISEVGENDISYMVLCHCKEADRFQVTRDLNRELLLLARQYDIQIVFPQITVNQPDPVNRPKTTAEQVKTATETVEKMRALPPEPEKEKFEFFRRARDLAADEASNLNNNIKDGRK